MHRRVLIILERGLDRASAMVSALQYQELFGGRQDYDVSFVNLVTPTPDVFSKRVNLLKRFRLGNLVDRLEEQRVRKHQEKIITKAADYDVVVELKIPQIQFHRRLVENTSARILYCFSDALWLPWFRRGGWEHLEELIRTSHGVVCDNKYLECFAKQFNEKVFLVNDCPQVE